MIKPETKAYKYLFSHKKRHLEFGEYKIDLLCDVSFRKNYGKLPNGHNKLYCMMNLIILGVTKHDYFGGWQKVHRKELDYSFEYKIKQRIIYDPTLYSDITFIYPWGIEVSKELLVKHVEWSVKTL